MFPDGFVPKRTSVEFDDMFPFDVGITLGRVGLTTARICILLSLPPPVLELEPLLCFKIPGLGRVPMLISKYVGTLIYVTYSGYNKIHLLISMY